MSLSETARSAAESPPRNFNGLVAVSEGVQDVFVRWRLQCPCSSTFGRIVAGEVVDREHLDPVRFDCRQCGKSVTFFDSNRDGYDGLLNGGASYRQAKSSVPVTCRQGHTDRFVCLVELSYNIDATEIVEIVSEDGGSTSDYFDVINIHGKCLECGDLVQVGDWECA
ncbi:hypothetical protein ABC347_05115 [Sphingomonas sp. 1P06PA]|uniref:hypothetical protein n=1 Tax=Sphingomonas sp. 1P06PA TaxID=554121 RepID=UPI0039A56B06